MTLSRRRFLAISAAALAGTPAGAAQNRLTFRALGADCSLTLPGPADEAHAALLAVQKEVARLDRAASLWRPDSELSMLNRDGVAEAPSRLFWHLVFLARWMADRTGGSFDPTVQPIWQALSEGREPDFSLVGWQNLIVEPETIRLARPGMALTLNGLAQGRAADLAVEVLQRRGYSDILANLGEFSSLGAPARGGSWRIGVQHPATGALAGELQLNPGARSLATSEPRGTLVRGRPHIIDPLRRSGPRWASVTVRSTNAVGADAVSTAIAAAPMDSAIGILQNAFAYEAFMIPEDGDPVRWMMSRR